MNVEVAKIVGTAQYTADDLLHWLRRRYRHISIHTIDWGYKTHGCHCGDQWGNGADGCPHERYAESWTVRLSHVGACDDDIFISDTEDRSWTLLEALEAAVLAVPGDA